MGSYTVGVAGLAVNQLLKGSGGSTPSLPTNVEQTIMLFWLTDNQKYDLVFEEDNELKKVSIKTTKQLNKTKKKNVVSLRTCGGNRSRQNIDMFDNTSVDYLLY